jgi:hypothetical protein
MRYLSGQEMTQYSVTTASAANRATTDPLPRPTSPDDVAGSTPIPAAQTGRIRHPEGSAPLKDASDENARNIATLPNGTRVTITSNRDRWFGVSVGQASGFVHHNWVYVDQFQQGPFNIRYIQVKSFTTLNSAEGYIRSSGLPLAAMLASNGWYAVTIDRMLSRAEALEVLGKLKEQGTIPADSYVTFGNTYVRKVCCF